MMATARSSVTKKEMCVMCSPKQVSAVTSCKGCSKGLCRKHFNEHRDTLSKDLHNVFNCHDDLLQDLQVKIDGASKPLDNKKVRTILKQIDEWEMTTVERVSQAANEARTDVQCLFKRKVEFDQLKQTIGKITEELKEQQESESFVETDIDHWMKQLEQLKIDLCRPSKFEINPPVLQIQNIDWNMIIKVCPPFKTHKTPNRPDRSQMNKDNPNKSLLMECPICTDSFPRSQMEEMFLCKHTCCLDCTKTYYRGAITEIRDPKSLNRLTCFMEAHEISDDVKLNFFQYLGTKLNQWFTDERRVLDLYHENLFIATRDSQDKKCGNPRCVGFFYNNNNRTARAQCPYCQFQQCQQCCRKWHNEHTNMTCEEYAEWLVDNDPDDPEVQLIQYLNTAGMVCPNEKCKAVYEYQAGGCEHFQCPACKTEFCRICSALFYNPEHNTICPRANCGMKKTLHVHCFLNCFREIRDAQVDEIIRLLTAHKINVAEELRQKPQATGPGCPVEGCSRAASVTCENRFCESCYKRFLCLLVWRNQLEPWELHTDANLRQKLTNIPVAVPATATRAVLIALAQQHLTQFLGKPTKIERRRQS